MRFFKLGFAVLIMTISTIFSAHALTQELTEEEVALIQEISAHHSAIEQMAGRFIQLDSSGNRAEGIFYIKRPEKIRIKYAPPSREEVVSVGRGFYVLNRKEETKYAYPQHRVPLRQFLSDQINLFDTNITGVTKTEEMIAISVSDETPVGLVSVTMIFDLKTKELNQWTLTEPNGNEVTFSVYDTTTDIEIPKAYFYIPADYGSPDR
ncbi:LolA family protein [Maritalea mediterranea]|uniref:Outer membrane lipoprotein carrier protein LolA n=1 Tax=Maritalea mediterranea TaxID=2909667 RepID=A0ABS9E218_9HYPH|nr:outer-membrane lipoprotein carrier protein LolA [Maritalea mediterranea]MCF4096904.1 outer membrane lipoprotein carrier protein LolA [Maritalea mediterranea]